MLRPYSTPGRSTVDCLAHDRNHLLVPKLLLAGESCPAVQPAVRAAAVVVLPGARGAARARRALRSQRGRRDPASPVHGGSGRLGPAVLHGLPDRCGIVAGGARHARSRIATPERRVGDDAGRGARARADLRLRGGGRDLWRARHASDARDPWRTRDGLVDAADGLTGGGDLRGALVPRAARGRARRRRPGPARLAPRDGRRGGHPRRRRDLLRLSLYRPLRRPLAALFVRVPDGRGAVLLGVVSRARIRDHRVDACLVRRLASPDAVDGDDTTGTATTRRTEQQELQGLPTHCHLFTPVRLLRLCV